MEKNLWNSRLKAENLEINLKSLKEFSRTVKGQNAFFNLLSNIIKIEKIYIYLETYRKS